MFNEAMFREIILPSSGNVNIASVLCQMGQPVSSSISTLFFLSITKQFTHTCQRTQNEEKNPGIKEEGKEMPKKESRKIRSSSKKKKFK